ncbi:MAG TPA: hypothetical protein VFR87_10300 [Nocardioidaceae bacterium]|nr:hypothetical protein [Nocardioidaceae bacterium]
MRPQRRVRCDPAGMNTRRLAGTLVSLALTGSLLVACGGEEQAAVCDDVDALRTSLTSLQAFDIYDTNVLSDLRVVLDQIRTEVEQLADDAADEYAAEIEVVQASIDDLESSAEAATETPTAASLSTLADAVKAFSAAFKDLRAAVGDTC